MVCEARMGSMMLVVNRVGVSQIFFFSSRRRHTRLQGDWSSDVCSSDLVGLVLIRRHLHARLERAWPDHLPLSIELPGRNSFRLNEESRELKVLATGPVLEIGRASCRERV